MSVDDLPIMGVGIELRTPAEVISFQLSMHQSYIWYEGIRKLRSYADIKADDHYYSMVKYRLDSATMYKNMEKMRDYHNGNK